MTVGNTSVLLLVLLTFGALCGREVDGKRPLYVGALFELSDHWYASYVNFFINIVEYAFQQIENNTDILADYSLKLITKDTKGKSGLAARRMFELMTDGPPVVAVLGPSLSAELTVVGQIGPFYNVLQLSYIATTSSTIDQDLFPTLFRVNQIMGDLNPLRIEMMRYFNWNRVGTIYFQDDQSVSQMNIFHDLLKQYNLTLVTSAVVTDKTDLSVVIARFLQSDVRIIMGSFKRTKAPKIFCEAYKQGLYGRNHVWIMAGPVLYLNWLIMVDLTDAGCTFDELVKATDGHFTLNYNKVDQQNTTTVSNMTPDEVTNILRSRLDQTSYKWSANYGYIYDTAWALALGLNNSLSYLNNSGLDDYTNTPYYLNAIRKGMHDVQFAGISGPVSFDEAGGRVGATFIEQNFNCTRIPVATHNRITGRITWLVPAKSLWPDGLIPLDSFTYHRVMVAPNVAWLVTILLVNTVCCSAAVGFLVFNIYYKNNSNIKLSSPLINNIIIVGSILMFVVVYLSALDYGHLLPDIADVKNVCMLRVWVMSLGFTSLFGALFSKTWRVHVLFRDYKLKKTMIKDYHLCGIIGFLLLVDCLILSAWSGTHSMHKTSVIMNKKMGCVEDGRAPVRATMNDNDNQIQTAGEDRYNVSNIISEVYTYCHHSFEAYWFISIYIYKGVLLVFGTFLAYESRHVTVPALNDSKNIGFCIYNVVIICAFGVPLMHLLRKDQTTLNFVFMSTLVMFCTTVCLCILFIPKIKLRNQVKDRFLQPSLNTRITASPSKSSHMKPMNCNSDKPNIIDVSEDAASRLDNKTTEELRKENHCLRMQIASETTAMARLKRDLLQKTGCVYFYKVGESYVVVQTDNTCQQQQNKLRGCELLPETETEMTS